MLMYIGMKIENRNRNEKQGDIMTTETTAELEARIEAGPHSELFTVEERIARVKRAQRNQANRERNAAIRELCGTSAACARRDGSV